MNAIVLPAFDPFLFHLGFLGEGWEAWGIRWYGLAWLAGGAAVLLGMRRQAARNPGLGVAPSAVEDLVLWAFLGTILGGRLGYVLFYGAERLLQDPLWALQVNQGGMSFHGGLLGGALVTAWWCRRNGQPLLTMLDLCAPWMPVALGLVRVANFINGELWGRVANVPWAMVFPGDPAGHPRHPSQLYEAFLEGLALWVLLQWLGRRAPIERRRGWMTGHALLWYGVFRFGVEFLRAPDAHLGLQALGLTRGQWLCVPLVLAGLYLVLRALKGGAQKR